jgi:hypothetical protein
MWDSVLNLAILTKPFFIIQPSTAKLTPVMLDAVGESRNVPAFPKF